MAKCSKKERRHFPLWTKFPNLSKSASGTGKLANCHKTHHVCTIFEKIWYAVFPSTVKLILRQNFLLDECNFLSENKLVAEAGKHHIGKQKGEQLFTLPTFRTFHRQAIALILKKSPKNLEIQHFEHANSWTTHTTSYLYAYLSALAITSTIKLCGLWACFIWNNRNILKIIYGSR